VGQLKCQASNVTVNVQSDHLIFATDQLHRPPHAAEIQPMSQQDASATHPYRGVVLDTRKMKKMNNLKSYLKHKKMDVYFWDTVYFYTEQRNVDCMDRRTLFAS